MGQSFSEVSMEAPPPWLSPDLSVWAAMVAPCAMVCRSFIALAQAGWPASADGGGDGGVFGPGVILPPVLVIAVRGSICASDFMDGIGAPGGASGPCEKAAGKKRKAENRDGTIRDMVLALIGFIIAVPFVL